MDKLHRQTTVEVKDEEKMEEVVEEAKVVVVKHHLVVEHQLVVKSELIMSKLVVVVATMQVTKVHLSKTISVSIIVSPIIVITLGTNQSSKRIVARGCLRFPYRGFVRFIRRFFPSYYFF